MSEVSQDKISFWTEHLNAQKASGLSQKAYCKEHNLKANQLCYWKRKIEGADQPSLPSVHTKVSTGFVPVKTNIPSSVLGLTITLPNGYSISGIENQHYSVVQQLIGLLK